MVDKSMRVESGVDRISALPDELLCHILSFVPTKLAVCTSVLSTRWTHLYTLVSSLDFVTDGNADDVVKAKQFMNLVERVLLFRTRPVERFRLKFHNRIDPLLVDGWIRALIRLNIQELDLCNARKRFSYSQQLPVSLFSCKTLVALKLNNVVQEDSLKIPTKALLPSLKVLHIAEAVISCSSFERLLSICPVLDDLVLNKCVFRMDISGFKLKIDSATLKRLTITFLAFFLRDRTPQIVINCPALVCLKQFLSKRYSVVLVAAENLAKVCIGSFCKDPPNYDNAHTVFVGIKNTHSLQIHDNNINIIQVLYNQNLPLPLFNKLTYLKICDSGCLFDSRCLEYLLARCVVLETFVLVKLFEKRSTTQNARIESLLQQSRPTGLLSHLKTVEVQLCRIEDAETEALMKTIEFFLINAVVLEKLSVRVMHFPDTQQLKISREIITLPRVSKNCQVITDRLSLVPCTYKQLVDLI